MTEGRTGTGPAGGAARNILLPPAATLERELVRTTLFETLTAPRGVVVSHAQSIEDLLSGSSGGSLDSLTFVSVGEDVRSTATTAGTSVSASPIADPTIEGVADETDLTGLGLTILHALREHAASGDGELVVWFDAISAVVAAASLRRAFRFFHILTNVVDTFDATAYYGSDDLSNEDLETLRPLFDAELDTQGCLDSSTWTVRSIPGR